MHHFHMELKRMATSPPSMDPTWPYPLTQAQIKDLDLILYEVLVKDGCDGTTRHTRAFLRDRRIAARRVLAWLRRRGGYCDCEVYMNVVRAMATW